MSETFAASSEANRHRAEAIFHEEWQRLATRVDRLFARLMVVQWALAIGVALVLSPYAWAGKSRTTHLHVHAALFLGGAISSLPIVLALARPGWVVTRHVVAAAQMLWSALLIHVTGGRIETHFHVFGSLAFLAFYRDYPVLLTASAVVVADHFLRGLLWPESVYGIANPEGWRFLEHTFWVGFADAVLVILCVRGLAEMRSTAQRMADIEALSALERDKSRTLDEALEDLKRSQDAQVRAERLAAIGRLAASVGHELRNPLAAMQNASAYLRRRLDGGGAALAADPRLPQFLEVIQREVEECSRIISDLLDFARERAPVFAPCPLRPLVDEAASVVRGARERILNAVPEDLPVPRLDKGQFRQVLVNLLQNAVEALPEDGSGHVVVQAEGGGPLPLRVVVKDDGVGIPSDVAAKIFEPLFTTKPKGTGLGLAVVASMVRSHRGDIRVESEPGRGARFVIDLPARAITLGETPAQSVTMGEPARLPAQAQPRPQGGS
jgi:signal transduction histidine kinase